MDDYRRVLKRVGFVLLAVGVVGIGYLIYCILNVRSYSSGLHIFAVIVALFLIRGGLRTARVVTWFSALMLTSMIGTMLFVAPFQKPLQLRAIEFHLDTGAVVTPVAYGIAAIALLAWVYRQLRSPAVVSARREAGQAAEPPKLAFALGALSVAALGISLSFMLNSDAGAKAIALAKARHGASYEYQVTAMRWSGNRVSANLTAYNESETKAVRVEW
jgi:hypothetical protein